MMIMLGYTLVALILFFVMPTKAHAAEPKPWKNWGIAPYAASQDAACKKASEAIDGFLMPSAVKNHFKTKLESTCKGGETFWLTPDMLLEQMWSGPDSRHKTAHLMNRESVAELPVLKSPDGRPYRKGSVAETAKALFWSFTYEGKTYVLYLPFVCFNWSWGFAPVPLPERVIDACATVEYTVQVGDRVRFAVLARKRLPASACWQLCDGDDCAAPPSPCDTCDWVGPKSVIPAAGFEPLHTGWYVARAEHQTLRFPLAVMSEYIALCDERDGLGESDSWIIQPSAWIGRTTIVVPYGGQPWPAWGQVDMSKWRKP
ncbi:MAG: hypothetical protein NUV60_00440 [Patescibacteria group bacterium]|nr:hypothetical protein [Patescibacteria group bacterium]